MFQFHYDLMLKKYGPKAQLLFTDTDSLCYLIATDDLYEDLLPLNDELFDTSQYPKDHILYSPRNAKVLGCSKMSVMVIRLWSLLG